MKEFLAVDIGASSGRHILGRVEDGILRMTEIYRFSNSPQKRGELIWDAEALFSHIVDGMKRAKELGHTPCSVGIDTWGVDYALLDRDLNTVGEVFAYRSDRTAPVIPSVHARVPFEQLYARTGIQFQSFNTIYQLCADKASGKLDRAEHLLMLPDYFHFLLTGKLSREYTNATTTGLINAHTRTWDGETLKALGLPEKLFPNTTPAGTCIGTLRKEIRDRVGYDTRVVLPATHDTASAVVASLAKGGPYLSSGTWSLLGILQNSAHTDKVSMDANYSNEGSPDGRFRLQKNIMGLWIIQQLRAEEGKELSFGELAQLAAQNENDAFIDVNDDSFLAPKSMKRAIEEGAGRSLTLGQAAYCVFNSLAKSYKDAIGGLSSITGEKYTTLNIIGGGSQNKLLNALTARETGLKIAAGPTEATAMGNLVMQLAAEGEISLEEAPALIEKSTEVNYI